MTEPTSSINELPEYRDNPFIARLPALMSVQEVWTALADPPIHREEERLYPAHVRVQCIQRLGRYFEPLQRHLQLEETFSILLRQGYISRNPLTTDYIYRLHDGHERVRLRDLSAVRHCVRSTASSFALVGCSGVGKSNGIERVLELYQPVINHAEPFSLDQVVWLKLDCPYIGSPKQLCISFFKEMDRLLGTSYLRKHGGARSSIDEMMVHMAHVANLHALGVLIIDEIQHLNQARGTAPDAMLNFLVTLVNTIGIPVIIIGTMGALPLLQGDFRQARRASGLGSLVWERMEPEAAWDHFTENLWRYQWTQEITPLSDDIRQILYEESQGIIDVVIKLFMLTQLRALQLGATRKRPEVLDGGLLRHVAGESFRMIKPMIDALKRNDRKAIAKYDDIRPLRDHVKQIFSDAQMRLSATRPAPPPAQPPAQTMETDAPEAVDPMLGVLATLGLADDIARLMLAEAKAEAPNASPLDLVAGISAKLSQRGPETKPAKPRRSAKVKPALGASDLRAVVAAGGASGKSGYESLLEAGLIKPPLSAFPL
ncbi:MAG: transposition protein C [Rhodospirillaceae bacterium BRH_c57]|nr:MAG: transposition protein C [Rhodospirillaceae bacterium BRH_c57]